MLHRGWNIPDSQPPISIAISPYPEPHNINPSAAILPIVKAIPHVCETGRENPFPLLDTFEYGNVQLTLSNMRARCGQFTYDNACITLTGLIQYILSLHGDMQEVQLTFIVDGDARGSGSLSLFATSEAVPSKFA